MTNYKSALQSLTIWGGSAAVVAALVQIIWGVAVSPADQVSLGQHFAEIASGVGGILAIIGRIRASAKIGGGRG
ncbi:hypothetical protein [Limimaricola cinnabarinus]|uniref:Uncharacterized protein n=1 Tax=Limimaricola cinnabarinus TaxID=1125964 RepID=A0A2G1MGX5_9RHOB|nr:hypothetical protein [Limimaricola cinnabarinus]PHP27988.1 hypothetical protein CJ301_08360 [Limimaricola cinnabarinus]